MVWIVPGNVIINKTWEITGSNETNTKVIISTRIKNNGTIAHNVSVRYMWDIELPAGYDAPYFRNWTDNFSNPFLYDETQWISPKFSFWEEQDKINENISFYGSMNYPLESTTPDKFQYAYWRDIYTTAFEYSIYPITNLPDSAVVYYWYLGNLTTGESKEVKTEILSYKPNVLDTYKFYIKNSSNSNVAKFGDAGNIVLKGNCTHKAVCTPPANSFIIANYTDNTTAYIDNQGNLCIEKGDCSDKSTSCNPTRDAFIIRNSTNCNMSYIDFNGDLCLKGILYENSNP